jgi:folate-binding Fe-S cluster repair protein YgfZ
MSALAAALDVKGKYESDDIPAPGGTDFEDFLWQELFEAARENVRQDPNLYSFFVVSEIQAGKTQDVYISPDWPSAEAFAKERLKRA